MFAGRKEQHTLNLHQLVRINRFNQLNKDDKLPIQQFQISNESPYKTVESPRITLVDMPDRVQQLSPEQRQGSDERVQTMPDKALGVTQKMPDKM